MRRAAAAIVLLLVGCALSSSFTETPLDEGLLRIYHFEVDQADSTLLISPSGIVVLFDCGDAGWNSSREVTALAPQLEDLVPTRNIDIVILSHLHIDHAGYVGHGGLWGLLETHGFSTKQLLVRDYLSYRGGSSSTGYELWRDYFVSSTQIQELQTALLGNVIDLGDGVTFEVCSVDGNGHFVPGTEEAPCLKSENDLSLGILISYGEYQEWIGGDLSGETTSSYTDIETFAAKWIGDVEVLRVNHHGSSHSSNPTFVGNLDPEVSIITVGERKSHGHPDKELLLRLASTSDVYITTLGNQDGPIVAGALDPSAYANIFEDTGNIVVETDGSTYWVNGTMYSAMTPSRQDEDGDGYFAEVDPDDTDAEIIPLPNSSS